MASKLFSLEYIRKRLFTENEQFVKARKGCNIKFHYYIGPFVMSSLDLSIVEQILESFNFQEAQRINYDPKKIVSKRKKTSRCGTFENQEVKGLAALANAEDVINEKYIADVRSRALESHGTINPQELDIQTPMKKDKGNNRSLDEATRMEVDTTIQVKELK